MSQPQLRVNTALYIFATLIMGCGPQSNHEAIAQQDSQTSAPTRAFAVVELFTSQGCSSCPSADQNLARIARESEHRNLPVYTLSFHVDYWNDLGWRDPFSSAEASQRQRQYAKGFRSNRVYTPQMIVNGSVELVCSDREKSNQVINASLRRESEVSLTATASREDGRLVVTWQSSDLRPVDVLNVALVQKSARRHVNAGENTGRDLHHVNVVRGFTTVKANTPQHSVAFDVPADFAADDYHVVVYVQSTRDGVIRAAARADFPSR